MKNTRYIIAVLVFILAAVIYTHLTRNHGMALEGLNAQLQAEGLQIGMTEEQLIDIWGDGEYLEGFGGHGRKYEQRRSSVGI